MLQEHPTAMFFLCLARPFPSSFPPLSPAFPSFLNRRPPDTRSAASSSPSRFSLQPCKFGHVMSTNADCCQAHLLARQSEHRYAPPPRTPRRRLPYAGYRLHNPLVVAFNNPRHHRRPVALRACHTCRQGLAPGQVVQQAQGRLHIMGR